MRICTLSDVSKSGGAAIAANRVAHAITKKGHSVSRISSDGSEYSDLDEHVLLVGRKYLLFSHFLKFSRSSNLTEFLRIKELSRQLAGILRQIKPNVINIHNLHSASWPIELVATALRHAPVSWTLHDCWSFSGRYYPTHSPPPSERTTRRIELFWNSLNKFNFSKGLSAITPSGWMQMAASAGYWKAYSVQKIHNPVPAEYFEEVDHLSAQRALGLNSGKPVVLVIAGNLAEERKGGLIVKDVLAHLADDEVQFLVIGNGLKPSEIPKNGKSLGFISDKVTLRIAYAAADLLLHPAPVDNLPNTVAEAMCCGTPVLAFNTGGLPEMIIPGKSGWLVEQQSSQSIITELRNLLESRSFELLREKTRDIATNLFSEERVSEEYLAHFRSYTTRLNPQNEVQIKNGGIKS
jgi:glycosyltransferase involved in cell wall biosynthesis